MTDEEYNRRWFERLVKRTVLSAKGCFVWQGPLSSKGYVMHSHRKWQTQAHRNVYRLTHRVELSREQQVCHSCDERRCWNPGHLFLGSNQDNCKDMAAKKRHQNNRKLVCKWGHPFSPENTRINIDKRGWTHRTCLTCEDSRQRMPQTLEQIMRRRARQKAYRAEKRRAVQPGDKHD